MRTPDPLQLWIRSLWQSGPIAEDAARLREARVVQGKRLPGQPDPLREARAALGRAVQLRAMREDPPSYEKFRFQVIYRCLVEDFGQEARSVLRLLRAEINGKHEPPGEAAQDKERLTKDRVPPDGGKPLAELAVMVINDAEVTERWGAMAEKDVEWTVTWLSQRVFWRVRDAIRGNDGGLPKPPPLPPPPAQHRVAAWLKNIAGADPDNGGFLEGARGMHAMVLRKIIEELDGTDEKSDGASPSYVLRKLFPPAAWPPEVPTATARLASWLLARLVSTWNSRADWPTTAAALGLPGGSGIRNGLDESAARHAEAADFPSTTEVGLWVGDLTAVSLSDPRLATVLNTLQHRVGRVDKEIEPFVRTHHDRLRRIAAEAERAEAERAEAERAEAERAEEDECH